MITLALAPRFRIYLLLAIMLFVPRLVFASGFFHPELGARSLMRGGANVLGGNDLSALYVNMANIANVDGTNVYFCVNYDIQHTYYRREPYQSAVRNLNPFDPIQTAAISSDFGLKHWTFAYGAYGPYGTTNRWPERGPQRYNIIESNAIQVYQSLAVAWNPTDWVRIGAKASVVNFKLINYYGFSVLKDRNPSFDVTGEFSAWTEYVPSWGAGIVLAPIPNWFEVGFSYLPSFDVTIVGRVKAEMPDLYATILGMKTFTDKIRLPLNYPPIYRGGVRFMYPEKFDVEFDVSFIPWTMLPYYDVDLEGEEILADFKYPLQWQDTWNYRLGGTYRLNDHWWFHGGYQYEDSANPPKISGTETDRHFFGTGLTMRYFGMDLDMGYAHIYQYDIQTPPPDGSFESGLDDGRGRYKTSYDMFVGAITFNFERMYQAYNGKRPW